MGSDGLSSFVGVVFNIYKPGNTIEVHTLMEQFATFSPQVTVWHEYEIFFPPTCS